VIDEAQDMNASEYKLVEALMQENEDMRTILVGDDDQNIYQFRGSDSKYMREHLHRPKAKQYDLIDNYRSNISIIGFCNRWAETLQERLKNVHTNAVSTQEGLVEIRQWSAQKLIIPAVELILDKALSGSTAVLTRTNETADMIVGMLKHRGKVAKLVQGNDGFSLGKMLEVAYFTGLISADSTDFTIQEELWEESRTLLKKKFASSTNLDLILNMVDRFSAANPSRKYKTDWQLFLDESKLENFVKIESDVILVSTIHRSKGREYDNVFVIVEKEPTTEEDKRGLYVAMTRAKSNLFVGYNGAYLEPMAVGLANYLRDAREFPAPTKISITLGLKHVWLGHFASAQNYIKHLIPGEELTLEEAAIVNKAGHPVLFFSAKFKDRLLQYQQRGFIIESARVNHIVYWWDKEHKHEVLTVLPEVVLSRHDK
jgi:ATP-dependent DNA helicase RecQ